MSEPDDPTIEQPVDPGFAPEDPTDGRKPGEWRSRYEPEAWRCIRWEAAYLVLVLLAVTASMFLIWLGHPQRCLRLSEQQSTIFTRHSLGCLSGILGGVIFGLKWLYHSFAKQTWNLDRRWWRYFTPVISGGLAFAMILVIESFGVFDPNLVSTSARTTAFGFLVGFFSDNALAKLAEVAQTLFGPTHRGSDVGRKKR
jgi:hypothetical protein